MLCGIVFNFSNHCVALRQQLVEVFVDVVLSERAAQIFGANHSFSPALRWAQAIYVENIPAGASAYAPTDSCSDPRIVKGCRRRPQRPAWDSNTPWQCAPQLTHRPSADRFQAVMSYQSRPINTAPHPEQ